MQRRLSRFALMAAMGLCATSGDAEAGASLLVDDAGTTPDGHCQLESWVRVHGGGSEMTAVPACAAGGIEYSVGGSRYTGSIDGSRLHLGLKHTFRDIDENAPGFALAIGRDWETAGRIADTYAYLATSVPLRPNLTLHIDLGANRSRDACTRALDGAGLEYAASAHWSLLGEIYQESGGYRVMQTGVRRALGHGISLDLLMGHDSRDGWITLGFNFSPVDP